MQLLPYSKCLCLALILLAHAVLKPNLANLIFWDHKYEDIIKNNNVWLETQYFLYWGEYLCSETVRKERSLIITIAVTHFIAIWRSVNKLYTAQWFSDLHHIYTLL